MKFLLFKAHFANRTGVFYTMNARRQWKMLPLMAALWVTGMPVYTQVYGLQIKFLNTGISDTTVYNQLSADFPNPVLTLMQVQDNSKHYIHGLAAMDKWLGPEDITEIGIKLDDVWKSITERHRDNQAYPPNQNVKEMNPEYRIAELSQVDGYGISMALAMDYSGSLGLGIYETEAAAKGLIRKINQNDQVAILKITSDVKVYQNFTSDTTLLMQAISTQTPDRTGTALNQGIYNAIQACDGIGGRRCVVVYTDGLNDMAGPSKNEIIQLANALNVTVFTIGLGQDIDEGDLGEIANETGGYYRRTPSPSSLALIYQQIYNYINGFYVLAHTSTDPFFNGTWRRIDVNIQSDNLEGKGWGTYYVPFLPRNVRVTNQVLSDSIMVFQGDTLFFATSDDTVSYTLTVNCDGPGIAKDIVLKNVMNENIHPLTFDMPPDTVREDTLIWFFPRMEGDTQFEIHYQAKISTYLPMQTVELKNTALISSPFDSIASDNVSFSVLMAKGHPDFKIRCVSTEGLASPGHPFLIESVLGNYGNAHATEPVTVRFYLERSGGELLDEITVPGLGYSDSLTITGIWQNPVAGTHHIVVTADPENVIKELREDNNTDSCTARIGVDALEVRINEITYRETVRDERAVFPDRLISRLNVIDQNRHTVFGLADDSAWIGPAEPAGIGENAGNIWTALGESRLECAPACRSDVRSGMRMTEIRKDSIAVAFVADRSGSMAGWKQQAQLKLVRMLSTSRGDRGAVAAGQVLQPFTQDSILLEQALQSGGNTQNRQVYDGCIQAIELAGIQPGRKAVVAVVTGQEQGSGSSLEQVIAVSRDRSIPVYLIQLGNAGFQENYQTLADTTGGYYFRITHENESGTLISLLEDMLRNYYGIAYASPDTLRDESLRVIDVAVQAYGKTAMDKAVYRAPAGYADLAIKKSSRAFSHYLEQNDNYGRVQPGDTVHYTLDIRNSGHYDLAGITIRDDLPGNLRITSSSMPYTAHDMSNSPNQIQWQIDSLRVYESTQIQYTCFVDTIFSALPFLMINQAMVSHTRDEFSENNISRDTLAYVPLKGPDLQIIKTGRTDSLVVFHEDTLWIADPGDTVSYTIEVMNIGEMACHDISLTDTLSKWLTLVETPPGASLDRNLISWSVPSLPSRGGSIRYFYTCAVDTFVPPWDEMILNDARVFSPEDTLPENNVVTDTLWIVGLHPPAPQIQAMPAEIQPEDTIQISVMTPVIIDQWDLLVFFEDGSVIYDYAEDFTEGQSLIPGRWIDVKPGFDDTFMRTGNKQERIGFVIRTTDVWGSIQADTAYVTIRSFDAFILDRNVFRPSQDAFILLKFKISSNRHANINIFDLAGHHVTELASRPFLAGWNELQWDGRDDFGHSLGSGVYLAVLDAGDFKKVHKFIVIR